MTGWLDDAFHSAFRECLAHTQHRYRFTCPTYCLMTDHVHMLWVGLAEDTDQIVAMEFFRRHLKAYLFSACWQQQAHDHVLSAGEREHGAFESVAWYILNNPVRAGFVKEPRDYAYSGCLVVGYPELIPFEDGFWGRYWRIDHSLRRKYRGNPLAHARGYGETGEGKAGEGEVEL
ncbi:MAG: hypothetical protein ISS35_08530 [Kiritimatiellae bacterium]|nr:hypothetical protein [Kiritimatiellia bacterium]